MNSDIVKGRWKQLRGEALAKWGKLTGDQFDVIAGDADKLIGKLQELYGQSRAKIRSELDALIERVRGSDRDRPRERKTGPRS